MSRTFKDSLTADLSTFFNVNEFAQPVTLSRGEVETQDVAAIVAERMYESASEDGFATAVYSVDFDFIATAYVISGATVNPRPGDRVTTGDGTIHEVLPVPGRPCFEPAGESGEVIRVHAKKIT